MSTETKKTTAVATKEKDITAIVLNKINTFKQSGELRLPKDYSAENALKSAYLVLNESLTRDKKPVLTACSQGSIANALLKMVVWGVSPLKGQIYFVPYGDKLEASVSYLGNVMMAKRYGKLKAIKANCIMKGDEFEFEIVPETGLRRIVKHKQTLQSIGSDEIIGAYAAFELVDGTMDVEIMNMDQIKKSWNQGATNGGSPAHKNFPDQMAQRTVLNRACKMLIRSSDDKVLYDDVDNEIDVAKEDVKHAISENANTDIIDIEHEEETNDDVDTTTGEIIDKKF
ncbi:RecT-like ssDNA annealing protein [Cellulophaga phage phi19:3]|uniref:RecT family protein n=1 Tax=Cellulophaga phage phi19:3 TaxID=1327971 RepID=R9ZWF0_9CAUD|nr:RecT-like ssDNA annealing protein [Cellulophaga phage phi19:3]AGO47426.1 RecT family protein [Cellulophaga phage phi19:3]